MKLPDFPQCMVSYVERWKWRMTSDWYLDLADVARCVRLEIQDFLSGPPAQECELLVRHGTRIPPAFDV